MCLIKAFNHNNFKTRSILAWFSNTGWIIHGKHTSFVGAVFVHFRHYGNDAEVVSFRHGAVLFEAHQQFVFDSTVECQNKPNCQWTVRTVCVSPVQVCSKILNVDGCCPRLTCFLFRSLLTLPTCRVWQLAAIHHFTLNYIWMYFSLVLYMPYFSRLLHYEWLLVPPLEL